MENVRLAPKKIAAKAKTPPPNHQDGDIPEETGDAIEDLDALPDAVDDAVGTPNSVPRSTGEENGDYGSLVIPIRKNKGQKLADVSHKAVQWYAHELEPTTPDARELQAKAKAYLQALQPA